MNFSYAQTSQFGKRRRSSSNDVQLKHVINSLPVQDQIATYHIQTQLCKHCWNVQALLLQGFINVDLDTEPARRVAYEMRVPLIIIKHQKNDYANNQLIDLVYIDSTHSSISVENQVSWQRLHDMRIRALQETIAHECELPVEKTKFDLLKNEMLGPWQKVPGDNSGNILPNFIADQQTPKARQIDSMTRQMDMDAVLSCALCNQIEAIVEATTENYKWITATLANSVRNGAVAFGWRMLPCDPEFKFPIEHAAWKQDGTVLKPHARDTYKSIQEGRQWAHDNHECLGRGRYEEIGAWLEEKMQFIV